MADVERPLSRATVAGGLMALLLVASTVAWYAAAPLAGEGDGASATEPNVQSSQTRKGWLRDPNARHDPGSDPTKGVGSKPGTKAPRGDQFAKGGKAKQLPGLKRTASGTGGSMLQGKPKASDGGTNPIGSGSGQ